MTSRRRRNPIRQTVERRPGRGRGWSPCPGTDPLVGGTSYSPRSRFCEWLRERLSGLDASLPGDACAAAASCGVIASTQHQYAAGYPTGRSATSWSGYPRRPGVHPQGPGADGHRPPHLGAGQALRHRPARTISRCPRPGLRELVELTAHAAGLPPLTAPARCGRCGYGDHVVALPDHAMADGVSGANLISHPAAWSPRVADGGCRCSLSATSPARLSFRAGRAQLRDLALNRRPPVVALGQDGRANRAGRVPAMAVPSRPRARRSTRTHYQPPVIALADMARSEDIRKISTPPGNDR